MQNRVDVAILDGPIGNDRFFSQLYLQQELVLVVPKEHPFAKKQNLRPDDLINQTILIRGDGSYTQKTMDDWFNRARITPTSTVQLSSRDAIIEAVACGMGVGFVFDKEVGSDTRVKKVALSGRTTRCNESLVCMKSQYRRNIIKGLYNLIPN